MNKSKPKIIFFIIISAFICYNIFTYRFFSYNLKHEVIEINSDAYFDKHRLNLLLNVILSKLKDKKILIKDHKYNIFICNNPNHLKLFGLEFGNPFGLNQTSLNIILINKSNIDSNIVFVNKPKYNRRSFTGVLIHELTHSYLYNHLGYFKFNYLFPTWKNEGFCDYIAEETSFPQKNGVDLIINNQNDDSYSFKYFTYYLRVKYLLDVKKESIGTFLGNDYDEQQLDREVKNWLFKTKEINLR